MLLAQLRQSFCLPSLVRSQLKALHDELVTAATIGAVAAWHVQDLMQWYNASMLLA